MVAPTDYSGLQGWWDASQEAFADTDPVGTFTDRSGNARHLTATTTLRPTFRTNQFPLGGSGLDFDGTDDVLTNASAISTFIANNAYSLFACFIVDANNTSGGVVSTDANDAIFADSSGYMGMHFDATAAPTYRVQAYNYDGSYDVNQHDIALSTAYVFHQRHGGGNLVSSLDGGTETSIASGNTSVVTGTLRVGRSGGTPGGYFDGKLAELFVYNVALATGEIAALNSYLRNKWIVATPVAALRSLSVQQAVQRASLR